MENETQKQGPDRRSVLKRGVIAAGAAWTAPAILDSAFSPAAAATRDFPIEERTPGTYTVFVPRNRAVQFTVIGGGGGGGNYQAFNGGAASQVTGTIPANADGGYHLTYVVAAGGTAGTGSIRNAGTGGFGYRSGGDGGAATRPNATAGGGGGGGGASALVGSGTAAHVLVVAPGGPGSGGGPGQQNVQGGPPKTPSIGPVGAGLHGEDGVRGGGSNHGWGGKGATLSAGGDGGAGNGSGHDGFPGTAQSGGAGHGSWSDSNGGGGGGGGGGYFGGGGGGGAGGGTGRGVGGGGSGGYGSTIANGVSDATASNADPTPDGTPPPNTPGHRGRGGYSQIDPQFGLPGGDGRVTLTLL